MSRPGPFSLSLSLHTLTLKGRTNSEGSFSLTTLRRNSKLTSLVFSHKGVMRSHGIYPFKLVSIAQHDFPLIHKLLERVGFILPPPSQPANWVFGLRGLNAVVCVSKGRRS